jgi:hypothetical protein
MMTSLGKTYRGAFVRPWPPSYSRFLGWDWRERAAADDADVLTAGSVNGAVGC